MRNSGGRIHLFRLLCPCPGVAGDGTVRAGRRRETQAGPCGRRGASGAEVWSQSLDPWSQKQEGRGARLHGFGSPWPEEKMAKERSLEAPNVYRRRLRRRFCQREALESRCQGRRNSGAQGCPEVKQEVTRLPAGHQQPWQWQVSTKGTEKEAGLRWSAQGRGHQGESVPAQGRSVHRPVLGAPGSGGAVLRALLEADGLRLSPCSADGSPCLVFLICEMGL